jgi:nucleoside-diphosphate-sugar epimerase
MKRILVKGARGFIDSHKVKRLKAEGHWVRGIDVKNHDFAVPPATRLWGQS